MPLKQPSYRKNRSHTDFLTNLSLEPEEIKEALRNYWQADRTLKQFPAARIAELAKEKYSDDQWNYKF